MVEYEKANYPEFSIIRTPRGNYYHQMGNYTLTLGEARLIPVNRSYIVDRNGDRNCIHESGRYKKQALIHERVDRSSFIINPETLVEIYGKPYLYLVDNQHTFFSSSDHNSKRISAYAREVLELTRSALDQDNLAYTLGIFGSHRVGLGGIDSDVDLVMWLDSDLRETAINLVGRELKKHGYLSSEKQGKDVEYAARYARRFGVSNLAGWYLAKKRNRFVDSRGISVSIQCPSIEFDHRVISEFFEGMNQEWEHTEVTLDCEVVNAEASYNFPKYWYLDTGNESIPAVSFSWMHQGMGDDGERYGGRYRLRAILLRTGVGKIAYLRDSSHFIIPRSLL